MQEVVMEKKSFSVLMVATAAFLIIGLIVAPLQASQYLGEVTWNGSSSGGSFTITAGLSRVGGSYYEIQGQGSDVEGTGVFSGGGVLSGNNLSLVVTLMDNNNIVSVIRINVNKNTLSGSFVSVNPMSYVPQDQLNSQSDLLPPTYPALGHINSSMSHALGSLPNSGTLTCTSQPFPLTASAAPQMPLLLE
jgi:hypothetical protein